MQVRKTRPIGVDGKHGAPARTAPACAAPYKVLPDKSSPKQEFSVTVGAIITFRSRYCRETMQVREGLSRHLTSQHPAKTGYQHGQEEGFLMVRFH